MRTATISYIILIFLIAVIGIIIYLPPITLISKLSFPLPLHKILESISSLILFLVFLNANNLYSKTKDKRMAIIAGGFLTTSILNIYHMLTSYGPLYDVLSVENLYKHPQLFFLQVEYEILAITLFLSIFYTPKPNNKNDLNFRRNTYLIYSGVLLSSIILYIILYPHVYGALGQKILLFESSLEITDDSLFFLSAFIFADMRATNNKNIFSMLSFGLVVLGLGQLFYINPDPFQFQRIIAHILKIAGYLFILTGIRDIQKVSAISYRQKLLAYLTILLIFAYIILVSLSSAILGVRFPSYSPFIFIEFLLLSALIQNIIATNFIKPVLNISRAMSQYKVGEKPEKISVTTTDEIGILANNFNKITESSWQYLQEINKVQEREKFLKEISQTSISTLQPRQILQTIVIETGKRFNAARCYFIKYDNNHNFLPIRDYESYISSLKYKDISGKIIEKAELEPFIKILIGQNQIVTVNDISKIDLPAKTKQFFEEYEIKSFIAAPVSFQDRSFGILMADFDNIIRELDEDEIELFSTLASQSANIVYKTKLFQETQTALDKADKLRRIISTFTSTLDINETLLNISKEILDIYQADRVIFTEFPNRKDLTDWTIRIDYISSPDKFPSNQVQLDQRAGKFWGNFLFNKGQVLSIDNVSEYDIPEPLRNNLNVLGIKSLIAIPIRRGEDIWGSITIGMVNSKHWTSDDTALLQSISDQMYLAIRQAELFSNFQKNAERESLLRNINELIRSSLDIDETLKLVCDETAKLFNVDRAVIVEFPDRNNYQKWVSRREYLKSSQIKSFKDVDFDTRIGDFWGSNVLDKGKTLAVNDIEVSSCPDFFKDSYKQMGINSIIFVPIEKDEDKWGILGLASINIRQWTNDDIELLETTAGQVYIAIKQAELYSSTQRLAERESLIRDVIATIRSSLDKEEVKNKIVTTIGKTLNLERAFINEFKPNTNEFIGVDEKSEYRSGPEIMSYVGFEFEKDIPGHEIIPNIIGSGKMLIINDMDAFLKEQNIEFWEYMNNKVPVKSSLGIPIKYVDQVLGVLVLQFQTKKYTFDEEFINLASTLADQAGIALYQARQFEKEKRTAERESLLRDIIATIRASIDINETETIIVNSIGKAFMADWCLITEYDEKTDQFSPVHNEYRSSSALTSMLGFSEWENVTDVTDMIRNRQSIIASDVDKYLEELNIKDTPSGKLWQGYRIKAAILNPIVYQDQLLGILAIEYAQPMDVENYTELTGLLADQIGIAIFQARLFKKEKETANREKLFGEIVSAFRSSLDLEEIKNIVVEKIGRALKADRCYINPYNKDSGKFSPVANEFTSSIDVKSILGEYAHEDSPEFSKLSLAGKEIISTDTDKFIEENNLHNTGEERYLKLYNVKSGFSIPIHFGDRLLGSLVVHYIKKNAFNDEDIQFVRTITGQLGIALYQAELYSITQEQGERSELTRRIIGTIGESLDMNKVTSSICTEILNTFRVDRVAIEMFVEGSNYSEWQVTGEAKSGTDILGAKDIDYPSASKQYIGTRLLEEGREIITDDIDKSDLPFYFINTHKKMNIKSLLGVPIQSGEDKTGALVLAQVKYYRHWTNNSIELIRTLAGQIYIAIRQAELYSRTKESEQRENFLRNINNEILSSNTLDEAINNICKQVRDLFNVDRVAIRFFDPVYKNFSEVKGEYRRNESITSTIGKGFYEPEINEYFIQELGENKKIIAINDINSSQYPKILIDTFKGLNASSTIVAPITYRNTLLALLFISNTESPTTWNIKEIESTQALTQQIALGINLFQVTDKLGKSLETEKTIKDIILTTGQMKDLKEIASYLLKKLADVFNVRRVMHLSFDEEQNLTVDNEFIKNNEELKPLLNHRILQYPDNTELNPHTYEDTIIINDINTGIHNSGLKRYLKDNHIESFIIYPKSPKYQEKAEAKVIAATMLCSTYSRQWSANEIDSFKLIIDAASLIVFEIMQRQETEETRSTFLATLTHDLRSPLNAEQKALEAILSRKLGVSLDNFAEFLQDMHNTNEELLRIVNNILSTYHYEEGKFELKLAETTISDLINESINTMQPLAKDQDSEITTNIQPDLPLIKVDKLEIIRVINNLVSNAIKHNTKGTSINVSVKKTNGKIQVSVHDNGKGIPEAERANIFQRYPTTKRKIGTGLGLYLSKQIIEAHNEKIWFKTEEGKGTTFYFTLPIA